MRFFHTSSLELLLLTGALLHSNITSHFCFSFIIPPNKFLGAGKNKASVYKNFRDVLTSLNFIDEDRSDHEVKQHIIAGIETNVVDTSNFTNDQNLFTWRTNPAQRRTKFIRSVVELFLSNVLRMTLLNFVCFIDDILDYLHESEKFNHASFAPQDVSYEQNKSQYSTTSSSKRVSPNSVKTGDSLSKHTATHNEEETNKSKQHKPEEKEEGKSPFIPPATNWMPISPKETYPETIALKVTEGAIPQDFHPGVLLKVGPNVDPTYGFRKRLGLFDGDGLCHVVRFERSSKNDDDDEGDVVKIKYTSDWVETPRRIIEKNLKKPFFLRLGELNGIIGLIKILFISPLKSILFNLQDLEIGPANTSLLNFDNRVFVLHEGSLPFEIKLDRNGKFTSVGYENFDEKLDFPFSAHSKVDVDSGVLYFHGCGFLENGNAAMKWGSITPSSLQKKNKNKSPSIDKTITINPSQIPTTSSQQATSKKNEMPFTHDFWITKDYCIFYDNSIRFNMKEGFFSEEGFFQLNQDYPLSFAVSHKQKSLEENDTQWFTNSESFGLVHILNAWQDEQNPDLIIIWAPYYEHFSPSLAGVENSNKNENKKKYPVKMGEFILDLPSKTFKKRDIMSSNSQKKEGRQQEHQVSVDFPTIHPHFLGKYAEYGFCANISNDDKEDDETNNKDENTNNEYFNGISKWHILPHEKGGGGQHVKSITFGKGISGGEPIVAPKERKEGNTNPIKSDEVYLLCYVYDENTLTSYLNIYDGETFDEKPVAQIKMPGRVPNGFHGMWMNQQALMDHIEKMKQ